MQRTILVLSLALAAGAVQARDVHVSCNVDSRYSLTTENGGYLFTQTHAAPGRVAISNGGLSVDGRAANLSASDQSRVRQFESELSQLLPESREVATEAIGIAFDALSEVARTLASNPRQTIDKLNQSRVTALREINSRPAFMFSRDDDAIDAVITPIVSEFVPEIVGGAVTLAFKSIFASDKERAAMAVRMNRMGQTLDQQVDARAKALEPLADSMCQRLKRMDALDNALDYRLPGGGRVELLSVDKPETVQTP